MIDEICQFNKDFVQKNHYTEYITGKYPNKKLAILTCMDTRLIELLPAALGLKNGDAKIIKNAGAIISHPYGSVVRSLLIAILTLKVEEIMVIGHTDCGVQGLNGEELIDLLIQRGIPTEDIAGLEQAGIDFGAWLGGFDSTEESVADAVAVLKEHPLIPSDVIIRGFIMDSVTGELQEVAG